MVYLNADNDLDYYGELDIGEMKTVGSTTSVNIVVLWDSWEKPAYVYKVLKQTKVGRMALKELTDSELNGREVNMGDGETLRDFLDYATEKFRSDRYVLVMWDHGDDFRGFGWDYHTGDPEVSVDYLTHSEITSALSGFELDILAFDGCIMSLIEVPYEYYVRGLQIDYFVGSEGYIPAEGFPYDTILARLTERPEMTPREFSMVIVDEYEASYHDPGWITGLSAIDMGKMGEVMKGVEALTAALMADMKSYSGVIGSGRGQSVLPWSEQGWEALIDFVTFVDWLSRKAPAPVSALSRSLLDGLLTAVFYVKNTKTMSSMNPGGLAVFFPPSYGSFVNNFWWRGEIYKNMAFASEVWLDFLYAYYKV